MRMFNEKSGSSPDTRPHLETLKINIMTNEELLEQYLIKEYPEDLENYQEKRDIFRAGVEWKINHPDFNMGCPTREWHYLADNPTDLPEPNKSCLIKFSDGTGGVSSIIKKEKDGKEYLTWVTQYRDDIVAWSYYVMNKVNGIYI